MFSTAWRPIVWCTSAFLAACVGAVDMPVACAQDVAPAEDRSAGQSETTDLPPGTVVLEPVRPQLTELLPERDVVALIYLVCGDRAADVKQYVQKTPRILEARTDRNQCLVHLAAEYGAVNVLEVLLDTPQADKQLLARVPDDNSYALLLACRRLPATNGAAKLLIDRMEKLPDPVPDQSGDTPYILAAGAGDLDILKLLVERYGKEGLKIANAAKRTPLHAAAANGQTGVVEFLMQSDVEFDPAPDAQGLTPLQLALFHGHPLAGELLMRSAADLSLLDLVLLGRAADIVKRVEAQPDSLGYRGPKGRGLLHWAMAAGKTESFEALCGAGLKPRREDELLFVALDTGSSEALQRALAAGCDPNWPDSNGVRPIHLAALRGVAPTKLLVEAGANFNARMPGGTTAMHQAAEVGTAATIAYLISKGAEQVKSDGGLLPLHFAGSAGNEGALRLLLEHTAPNALTRDGQTVLHMACLADAAVLELLLEKGVDPTVKDKNGLTAADLAEKQIDKWPWAEENVQLLREAEQKSRAANESGVD